MMAFRFLLNMALILYVSQNGFAQRIEILNSGTGVSFRGLSVVNNHTLWVSGSKGTVGISTNSGKSWHFLVVEGYETRDFRDIEAFDGQTAVIMAVGEPAVILRTSNAGKTWKKVYENNVQGMFLDAMEFWNDQNGMVVGDPINNRFFVARTSDGGRSWKEVPNDRRPMADSGEACFAASGTNLRLWEGTESCFVSGGLKSRLFGRGAPINLPVAQGKETQGANSVAVWLKGNSTPHIIVVGGDFNADSSRMGNCVLSRDGGKSWIRPSNPPYGYRSCVEFISSTKLVSCGLNGVDLSYDEGLNWNNISATGFHVCRKAKNGDAIYLAGLNGYIGRINLNF